ncbi:MAG: type II secretion system protein J [Cyanobacteriota bacterium]|jgi:prepilin-type N-terminal cleavage/methylation domain-containing protein
MRFTKNKYKRDVPSLLPFKLNGFSLVEVLIAAALLGLIASITASIFSISNRSTRQSGIAATALAAIDNDISGIKQLAETLTCCPGGCTTDQTLINSAITAGTQCKSGSSSGVSSYYFPLAAGDVTAFTNACNATTAVNDSITSTLITSINARPLPSGASSRTAVVDAASITPTSDEIAAHRVRVTYTGTVGTDGSFVNRTIKIVPTAANFCP